VSFNTPLGHPDRFQPGPPNLHPDAPALAHRCAQWTHSRFVRARTVYLSKSRQGSTAPRTAHSTCGTPAVNTLMRSFFTFFGTPRHEPRTRSLGWLITHTPTNSIPCAPAASSTIFAFPPQDARMSQPPRNGVLSGRRHSATTIFIDLSPPPLQFHRLPSRRHPDPPPSVGEKERPRSFRSEAASPPIARASVYPHIAGEASPRRRFNPRSAPGRVPPLPSTSFCDEPANPPPRNPGARSSPAPASRQGCRRKKRILRQGTQV